MYCEYAHSMGFSVRKEHLSYWIHTRIIKCRAFCCAKAGLKRVRPSPKKYRKLETRTGCLACIYFTTDTEGRNWTVTKFVEEHNHPLAMENEQHLLRSARSISKMQGSLIKNLTDAGVKTVHAYNFLSNEVGGFDNVGFSKSNAYNFVQREKKALIERGDSLSLLKILQEKQLEDNMFSYDVRTDELSRLTSFFWMDGQSKIDYDCYGDVVIFDTTYRLNKYNLACAPFIAVNNHWQNVFVGGAFISEESIDSFCWVFNTFLKFVGGKLPTTIFTDQDQAMAVAIERVFIGTRHRLCQWHISKKAPSKVPCFNNEKTVRGLFYQCMSKCDSELEFDRYWNEMISRGNLQENRWLGDLHRARRNWSTAFNKDVLDLGILSTQRSESANNGLHGCSKATSTLVECFMGLEKLVGSWRRGEQDEDFRCKQGAVSLKVRSCAMLKHVSKFYTSKMFVRFEQAFMEGAAGVCVADETRHDENNYLYVTKLCDGSDDKRWFVSYNSKTNETACSCRGFETRGILCKHILRIYNLKNLREIPPVYLLKRFCRDAKKGIYLSNTPGIIECNSNLIFRNHLMRFAYDLANRVENNKDAKAHVLGRLHVLANEADEIVEAVEMRRRGLSNENDKNTPLVRDPVKKNPKGISNARLKGYWETGSKKPSKTINLLKIVITLIN
ncbi:Protein FAR1-RELATED SEQUENCE 7 [Platanthera zijinensis]|uniref:Protein FAR1-RELATED SEQUENCE 7 n=1 Tax=Platanthera zijinensis TaxID=2320716 RepID=A0AAP0BDM8_9ASPA